MINRIHLLSLAALTALASFHPSAASAQTAAAPAGGAKADPSAPSKRAVFSGTINSQLPSLMVPGAPKKVYFPLPNTILFSGTKYCGDGDVANYSNTGVVNFFKPDTTSAPVALGYWVIPATAKVTDPNTRPENGFGTGAFKQATWFMLGWYDKMPVDGGVINKLYGANDADYGLQPAFDLAKSTLVDLSDMGVLDQKYYSNGTAPQYKVMLTAMTCPTKLTIQEGAMTAAGALEGNGATALAISRQFLTGRSLIEDGGTESLTTYLRDKINASSQAAADAFVEDFRKVKVVTRPNKDSELGIRLKADPTGTGTTSLDNAVNLVKAIIDMPPPIVDTIAVPETDAAFGGGSCPCNQLDYAGAVAASAGGKYTSSLLSQLSSFSSINAICSLNLNGLSFDFSKNADDASQTPYEWEPYPTHAACNFAKSAAFNATNNQLPVSNDKATMLTTANTVYLPPVAARYLHKKFATALFSLPALSTALGSFSSLNSTCPASTTISGCAALASRNVNIAAFVAMKNQLASIAAQVVLAPAIVQAAQIDLKNQIKLGTIALNRASCFPTTPNATGLNYVRTVGGALGLPIQLNVKNPAIPRLEIKDPGKMVHPEGNFATGGDVAYKNAATTAGDHKTMFNNTVPVDSAFVTGPGTPPASADLDSPGVHVNFNIRAVGCSQNSYCANDLRFTPVPFDTFGEIGGL